MFTLLLISVYGGYSLLGLILLHNVVVYCIGGLSSLKNFWYNVLVTESQLFNVIILLGDPDESVSGRIGKLIQNTRIAKWDFLLIRHFLNSIEKDEGGNNTFDRQEIV